MCSKSMTSTTIVAMTLRKRSWATSPTHRKRGHPTIWRSKSTRSSWSIKSWMASKRPGRVTRTTLNLMMSTTLRLWTRARVRARRSHRWGRRECSWKTTRRIRSTMTSQRYSQHQQLLLCLFSDRNYNLPVRPNKRPSERPLFPFSR